VILIANKCEGQAGEPGFYDAYSLGMGEPIPISAEHGENLGALYEVLQPLADAIDAPTREAPQGPATPTAQVLQMAIVGQPNVGKSTLVNQLLGENRMVTGPEAGITRDSITIPWEYQGRPVRLVDTAGLRRQARIEDKLETLSAEDSFRAVQYAQLVVLTLDATLDIARQDLTIARRVVEEGRILIIALNKWDLVTERAKTMQALNDRLEISFPQVKDLHVITISALTGDGLDRLMPACFAAYDVWNKRVPTARLNDWLKHAVERHPPPLVRGRRIRLRYMTQAKTRPPTFIVFSSMGDELPEDYKRYLLNGIREDFGLPGIPLRLEVRQRKNPYAED
jgi:GTP-binding protein